MADFKKYPYGKDRESEAGFEINGKYYSSSDCLIALAKALIKKNLLTRQDIINELY